MLAHRRAFLCSLVSAPNARKHIVCSNQHHIQTNPYNYYTARRLGLCNKSRRVQDVRARLQNKGMILCNREDAAHSTRQIMLRVLFYINIKRFYTILFLETLEIMNVL